MKAARCQISGVEKHLARRSVKRGVCRLWRSGGGCSVPRERAPTGISRKAMSASGRWRARGKPGRWRTFRHPVLCQ